MNENLVTLKATLTAFFSALAMFLGWRVIMLMVWVVLMALDYLSGTLAARQNGTWKSSMAREGIGHKAGMILIVAVCAIADFAIALACQHLPHDVINFHWPFLIFPVVVMWYIITEIGSIIENAIEMGAKVPSWLPMLLNATLKVVDTVGEEALGTAVPELDTNSLYSVPEDLSDPYAVMGFDHDEHDISGLVEDD